VATGPTTAEEDAALSKAISAHERRPKLDDFSALTEFLAAHPNSAWTTALQTNLGLQYLHYGHFTKALQAWQQAWQRGRDANEPRARALTDRAVGELARLYTGLGQSDRVEALLKELGDRAVTGSATEAIQNASEQLLLLNKEPRHLFICGPLALRALMLSRNTPPEEVSFLQWYRAGPNGTNLAELGQLADRAKLKYRVVFREAGQPVPVPSVMHWKVGHFAAITGQDNGRFRVEDSVIRGQVLWATPEAIDAEASGYFLIPEDPTANLSGRPVGAAEAARVWGKGNTASTIAGGAGDPLANEEDDPPVEPQQECPMCSYNIKEASVSLTLSDWPVGYAPAIGPSAKVKISYNQREDSQPANFGFFNVSPKWTLNWLSYVTDDPANPGGNVSRYLAGGGAYYYSGYNSNTKRFAAQFDDGSILVRLPQTPVTYRRQLKDGSAEIYAQSDGSTTFPRRIFLSQIIDPQGNALTLAYDSQLRLTAVTDALGRQTTLSYGLSAYPLQVTRITDPFGRSATLAYDAFGRLLSITDIIGLTSRFTYDANSLVNSLTTPYGTTTFTYTAPGTSAPPRFVQVADPLGFNEREEWLEPSATPSSDNAATVPQGTPITPTNLYLQYRNSFHWNKDAYVQAGCTPTGGCNYTKGRIRHFLHVAGGGSIKGTGIESAKHPLENRIWYSYPGQTNSVNGGTYNRPTAIGRVLDDGTTQLKQLGYDTAGYFNLTRIVDPLGRTTTLNYSNQIDLTSISQTDEFGFQSIVAQFAYNSRHRPLMYVDAAGQPTTYTYNAAGQTTSVTTPLGQTTQYQYDTSANLTTIINANNVTAASYTYDSFARIRTYTDSEGWTATYDYDAADRVTKITYPDGTTDTYAYDRLDLASYRDRQGRLWRYTYDANRRRTTMIDPSGQQTLYGYNRMGQLTSLTDAKSNTTTWAYDLQGRLTTKQYADTSTVTYTYENTTSRLKSVTDALGQVKTYTYAKDDRPLGIAYTNAVNSTPNVAFTYDPYFPRLASMTDGTGTRQHTYVPVGSLGALKLQQESGPLPNSAIANAYDELGRLSGRTVAGSGAETFQYDAIGRLTGRTNDLGAFTLDYLGQTDQIATRTLASSPLATTWSYLDNTGDRRLAGIANTGLAAGQFSTFQFTTTPEDFITSITETSDAAIAYPAAGTQTATYDNLNQLTNLSGQALTRDANGNLTADGLRTYSWDAENRLVGIAYPGLPGKATAFAYDGLGRRTTISETPAGGGSIVTTSYIWCGQRVCQARDASNSPIRSYYKEGEFVPGSPAQPIYYGVDQLGSVRRAFASPTNAPAYAYDPYGVPLQVTVPLTDFGYAGMLTHAESGLYLTNYRAYDPVAGRWLSRDPLGESSDPAANLYAYVGGNPLKLVDPLGLVGSIGPAADLPGGQPIPSGPRQGLASPWERPGSSDGQQCTPAPDKNIRMAGTPSTGAPNTWVVNPGSGQMRLFGPNGLPVLDIDSDHSHKGVGKPHMHIWLPNPGGFPIRGPAIPVPAGF